MTNKSAMEKLFKRAWEKNERGTAYLAFMEELPEKLKDYGLVNGKTKISQYVFYKLINKHKCSRSSKISCDCDTSSKYRR